ncbi:MAG: hypothetical protein H6815_01540 [Phycisphaeraceae bacterium]|nr:hypothetical protein [Phycisphaerales bacterium]MCB9859110.1 hypothetical protein [Phycisphaeraceae bacterium]
MKTSNALLCSALVALLGGTTAASAQTRSSFLSVDAIAGVSVTQLTATSFEVSVSSSPTFSVGGSTYNITDLFGFWALADTNDLLGTSTSSFSVWNENENNASAGGIAGWKTNPNTGLTASTTLVFNFDAFDANEVDRFGFHVRLDGTFPGTSGNTGHITVVPAPATFAGFAGLGLVATRRRR